MNAKDDKCSSTSVKELAERDKKHHCRDACFKIVCCKTLDEPPLSLTTCLFSPLLVSNWATRQSCGCLRKIRPCQTSHLENLIFSLFSHKVSFSLSSEYESKQPALLSTHSCHSFKRKILGECYTLPNICAGSGTQEVVRKHSWSCSSRNNPFFNFWPV